MAPAEGCDIDRMVARSVRPIPESAPCESPSSVLCKKSTGLGRVDLLAPWAAEFPR
jgi:hypothetical protein